MSALLKTRRGWVLILWVLLLAAFWGYTQWRGIAPSTLLSDALAGLSHSVWAPLVLAVAYLLRPLTLIPITVLTLLVGFLFGPIWGMVYAVLAMALSSGVGYFIGRYFGADLVASKTPGRLGRWSERLKARAFETVLMARFLFLPGDLVTYTSGVLGINFAAFMLATVIGGIPGLLIGVLAGASLEGVFTTEGFKVNAWYLLASAALLVLSLSLSYLLRRKTRK